MRDRCPKCGVVREDVTATRPGGKSCAECAGHGPVRSDGGADEVDISDHQIARQRQELRQARLRARQVSVPFFGEIDEGVALAGAVVLGGAVASVVLDDSGGSGSSSSSSSGSSRSRSRSKMPDPADFEDRNAFMSQCLEGCDDPQAEMKKCAKRWRKGK